MSWAGEGCVLGSLGSESCSQAGVGSCPSLPIMGPAVLWL